MKTTTMIGIFCNTLKIIGHIAIIFLIFYVGKLAEKKDNEQVIQKLTEQIEALKESNDKNWIQVEYCVDSINIDTLQYGYFRMKIVCDPNKTTNDSIIFDK